MVGNAATKNWCSSEIEMRLAITLEARRCISRRDFDYIGTRLYSLRLDDGRQNGSGDRWLRVSEL